MSLGGNLSSFAYKPSGIEGLRYAGFSNSQARHNIDEDDNDEIIETHQAISNRISRSEHKWTKEELKVLLIAFRFTKLASEDLAIVLNNYFPGASGPFKRKMTRSRFDAALRASHNSEDGRIWTEVYEVEFCDPGRDVRNILKRIEQCTKISKIRPSRRELENNRVLRLYEKHHRGEKRSINRRLHSVAKINRHRTTSITSITADYIPRPSELENDTFAVGSKSQNDIQISENITSASNSGDWVMIDNDVHLTPMNGIRFVRHLNNELY